MQEVRGGRRLIVRPSPALALGYRKALTERLPPPRRDLEPWLRRWLRLAAPLAARFVQTTARRVDRALAHQLDLRVRFHATPLQTQLVEQAIRENVQLITNLGESLQKEVEDLVAAHAPQRDLQRLTAALEQRLDVARSRAQLIARDQTSKVTAELARVRYLELGVREAIWVHVSSKNPRPSHLQAGRDRQRYDISTGWLDPELGQHIFPGELINCRCVSRPLLPGLDYAR